MSSYEINIPPGQVVSASATTGKGVEVSLSKAPVAAIVTTPSSQVETRVQGIPSANVLVNGNPGASVHVTTPSGITIIVGTPGSCGSCDSVTGGVFITGIEPFNPSESVSNKVYDFDSFSLDSVDTTTEDLIVSVVAVTGHSSYTPVVTILGQEVPLVETPDSPIFTGQMTVNIASVSQLTAKHADGAQWTTTVNRVTLPQILSLEFTGAYPGIQTELKAGDTFELTVTADQAIASIEIADYGALVAGTRGPASTFNGTIADRGNTALPQLAMVRVSNAAGAWSPWFESTNSVVLNNQRPVLSISGVTYPVDQGALKDNEEAVVSNSASFYSSINYSSSELLVSNSLVYESEKVVSRATGTYNVFSPNLTISAVRNENGSSASVSTVVKIANVAATLDVTTPSRLRSNSTGLNHTVSLTASQQLLSAPALGAPSGTWQGSWSGSGTSWSRAIQIHDTDAKGTFAWDNILATNLAGIPTTTVSTGSSYIVGGFVFRTLTVAAFPNRETAIGTLVMNTGKLRCTNLSKGSSGSLNFTYQATTDEAVNKYTILNDNTWYNCDGANASSNTTGTMQVELEEVV